MQHIITPDPINFYAEQYTTPEDTVQASLNRETHAQVKGAQMISGHLQGTVLQMLSHMIAPTQVLELGTYTGYSAISLARGLKPGGKLHTIDIDPYLQDMRNKYWNEANLQDRIVQHIGEAATLIPKIKGDFDLVFIDADKKNYSHYFDLLIDRIPAGGFMIADNVLFHGEVILPKDQQSNTAGHIHEFNKKIAADDRVEQVIMPVRDGLMLIRKK
ncbi:O-methyltransferase [Taibaiella koreensis]|uniref:O-methyltransferase n=1 Tax=Taibaiella koreensis TaxID=1268548 RepID=UPI000E59BA53|nr:class I SAM-dependent methyltransferase [Taibaiella koreensis]